MKRRNIPLEQQRKLQLVSLEMMGNHHGKSLWCYEEQTPPQDRMYDGFEKIFKERVSVDSLASRELDVQYTRESVEGSLEQKARVHRLEKVPSRDARLIGIRYRYKKL